MGKKLLRKLAKAIAKRKIRIVDLTQTLKPSTPVIQLPPEFAPSAPFSISEVFHTSFANSMSMACRWSMLAAVQFSNAFNLSLMRLMLLFFPTTVSSTMLLVR